MASLVADYSDSEDESNSDSQNDCLDVKVKEEIKEEVPSNIKHAATSIEQNVQFIKTETTNIKEEPHDIKDEAPATKKHHDFFSATNDMSDDEDREESSHQVTAIKVKKELTPAKDLRLPNPMSLQEKLPSINAASSDMTVSSVFINKFERAEQAKNSVLERHVRMTEAAPKKPAHQPMCWKFKKGNCHLGKNCRFFHDVDTIFSDITANSSNANANTTEAANVHGKVNSGGHSSEGHKSVYHPAAYHDARRRRLDADPEDDDNYMASMKKKKRFGINDALMPPKKAYDSLLQLRQKERPWTMSGAPR